jgi:predicted acetyltransferase
MPDGAALRLRELRPEDEEEFRAAHDAMAADADFDFALGLRPDLAWPDYLRMLADHRAGRNLPAGWAPGTFLVADVGGRIVGRASIRHRLNATLEREGGHIGYGVLPEHRRRGYATAILRECLVVTAGLGITSVLVTCDEHNTGSRKVIEACGGRLESVLDSATPGALVRRYRIG